MTWIEWATKAPGPPSKQYSAENTLEGFVCHSAEAGLASLLATLHNLSRQASWHFSLAKTGELLQHYPLEASCWASGNFQANTRYVAMEAVGFKDEPLTEAQQATAIRLWRELGFTQRGVNLFEHREVATKWTPNAGPTACPSGRYDAAFAALEGDELTPEEAYKLEAVWLALTAGNMTLINEWNANGNSLLAGYAGEQQKLAEHIDNHHGSGLPQLVVPDHEHEPGQVVRP